MHLHVKLIQFKEKFSKPSTRYFQDVVIAGMATMPTRKDSFIIAFNSLIRQVDHLYLYLDHFSDPPEIAANNPKVTMIYSQDFPGLHANGKLMGLRQHKGDFIYVCADDDIYFPHDYIVNMRKALQRHHDRAIVGLHGNMLARPFKNYFKNRKLVAHYNSVLKNDREVDLLGSGAIMFKSGLLDIDVTKWPPVSMTDLGIALAAAEKHIPCVCISRKKPFVRTIKQNQTDSLYKKRKKDSKFQSELGERLVILRDRS